MHISQMRKWLLPCFILLQVLVCHVLASDGIDATKFRAMDFREASTGIAASEDGRFLFVAHRDSDTVSIIDTRTGVTVVRLSVSRPGHMLYRGRRLFVTHQDKGAVSLFSADLDWGKVGEIVTGEQRIHYLSGPSEPYFDGTILASAGSGERLRVLMLDANSGKCLALRERDNTSLATMSTDGSFVVEQRMG